tara:strand:+ start:1084 stop:1296 length:213 start_codon:yes stop_codon:yes gene_type:complete
MAKISDLPQQKWNGKQIDNCYYVEDMNQPTMKVVKISSIFEDIKKRALNDSGLTVKFTGDNIIFIEGNAS